MLENNNSKKHEVNLILKRQNLNRFVNAPNYWQWFAHQRNHGLHPDEIVYCKTQLDLIKHLGLDIFSRNIYSD
jgi:hypothetical protein